MVKKLSFVGAICASLFLAVLTPAQKEQKAQKEAPAPQNAAAVLAILDGTINFCSKVNPQSEAKYKDLAKLLTNNQNDEAVAQMRNSKEYKDSLDQISKKLGALSTKEALEACKAGTAK
jgi:hypothetical protein